MRAAVAKRAAGGSLFNVALVTIVILVAATLLYPESYSSLKLSIGGVRIIPMLVLFALAASPVAFYLWRHRRKLHLGTIDLALLANVCFVTVTGLLFATSASNMGLVLALAGYTVLLYYGVAVVAQNPVAVKTIFYTLAMLGVIIASYAIVEHFVGKNIIYGGITAEKVPIKAESAPYHRSSSSLGNPPALGLFMVQVVPFLLFFFVRASARLKQVLWGAAVMMTLAALLFTFSKGSWIAALVVLVFALFFLARQRRQISSRLKISLIVVFVSCLAAMATVGLSAYRDLSYNVVSQQRQMESFGLRWIQWSHSPASIAAHPLIGVGVWQGAESVFQIMVREGDQHPEKAIPVDNLYLNTLVEEGLVGFFLLGATLALIGIQAWRLIRKGLKYSGAVVTIAASMAAVLINGFTVDILLTWPIMVVFWMSAGMVRARAEISAARGETPVCLPEEP